MSIKISVIIPCYNHGKYLSKALESVLEFDNKSVLEVIVVNDGSTDPDTLQVLESINFDNVKIINQANEGLAKARNHGIRLCKGEYVLPLDSDNYINPRYLNESIQILEQNKNIGVVYSDRIIFTDYSEKKYLKKSPSLKIKNMIFDQSLDARAVFRKKIWEQLSGYDEKMPIMGLEDWDFWIRAMEAGVEFHHINKGLFYYRDLPNSMIKNAKPKMDILMKYMIEKHSTLYARYVLEIGRELSYARRKPFRHFVRRLFSGKIKLCFR